MGAHYVRTQSFARPGRAPRWAYALHIDGSWAYVSAYRYGSEATARAAGDADLAASLAAQAEESP